MRNKVQANGLVGLAVSGTYVVLLGWDVKKPELEEGLLGFAIQRQDKSENETTWLRGMKTFPNVGQELAVGGTASTQEQPIQSFQWADYAAKPGHDYEYSIYPMSGDPSALTKGKPLVLPITTEQEDSDVDPHSVYFNRAAIASQEYARKFQNKAPNVVGQAAYDWLSRGLLEGILAFIAKASGAGYGLRVAIYEFQWPAVLNALKAASKRGVDVKVVFDDIENAKDDPKTKNEEAISTAKLSSVCTGYTNGKIMHNKFIVLLQEGKPVEVLTGSTNYTENGIFGHLNVAHVVRDEDLAASYLDFWTELKSNPEQEDIRAWCDEKTGTPDLPVAKGVTPVFSPQKGTQTLTRYGDLAGTAKKALFMTFAFGMNAAFQSTYLKNDSVLRFALMDKAGVGKNLAAAENTIDDIRALPNAVVAIGQNITLNEFDRWLKERAGLAPQENVRWVHTKFMLVDPLSNDPIVVTGSANFSAASVNTNQENMILIRGNKRVADIYLGEFMRQYSTYAFRDAAAAQGGDSPETFQPQSLEVTDKWQDRYRDAGSSGALRKSYFSGQ